MEVRSKATWSCSKPLGVGSGIYRALTWKEKRVWKTGLKVSQVYYLRLSTLLKGSAVWWLCLQHWYWIYWGFFGTNPSSLSSWMQSHTKTLYCLPTCLGKMPDDCSIHACSWFSGKPSKIHPYWTKTRSSYWSWKGKKNPKIHTKPQCYLHKNYLILISPQHSISHGCLWEKKANMEHWYFCEMPALIPLPHSNGNLWIVAMVWFFLMFQS